MYADFVSEVDPKGGIMDWLLQEEVVTFELKDRVLAETTRQDRCRKLLDVLLASSNPRAFVVLREALVSERKTWIVERIDAAAYVTPTSSAAANGRYRSWKSASRPNIAQDTESQSNEYTFDQFVITR